MNTKALTTSVNTAQAARALLMPDKPTKDSKYRIGKFAKWLESTGSDPLSPDLAKYRDFMLTRYSAGSTSGHLSTIRARYRELLTDNELRDELRMRAQQTIERQGQTPTQADIKAMVDEAITRLTNGVDPVRSKVKQEKVQDKVDSKQGIRLTKEEASALIASPGTVPIQRLRDTAVIALLLCTGIRERELCNLDVDDLRQTLDGELCLYVRLGKGKKTRAVPYGALSWVLAIVDKWLDAAHISEGPVFRGFYKGNRRLRPGRLSVRAVEYILGSYPVMIEGKKVYVAPHDCRRTYARRLWEAGVDPVIIQQNLGHADLNTTLGYIGHVNAKARRPPAIYTFDLAELDRVSTQGALVE